MEVVAGSFRGERVMQQSAGTLLYRTRTEGLEVLLVHASGWYNRQAPWGIPKGIPAPEESDLEATARRETLEETGVAVTGPLVSLGNMIYRKSRKQVHCFAGPAPRDASPKPASWEVDQVAFMPLPEARQRIHPDQQVFLDRLIQYLAQGRHDEGDGPASPC
jgi:predicted NUDIX family NTP pyrophosphohydrolase